MRPELQEIADEASRILRGDVTIEDRDFNLVAFGTQHLDVDVVRQSSILQRRSAPEVRDWFESFGITTSAVPVRTPADPDRVVRSRLCLPIRWRGVTYGYIWSLDEETDRDDPDDPAVARAMQLAEHAGAYLAQLSRQHEDNASAVIDVLSSDTDTVGLAAIRIADRGLIARRVPMVAVVIGAWGAPLPSAVSPNLLALPRHVLADTGPDSTTLLLPARDSAGRDAAQDVAALVLDLYAGELPPDWGGQLVAGIGDPRPDIDQARGSWLEARLAARVAAAQASTRPIARWEDLGFYRLLAAAPDSELANLLLDPPVRRLLDQPDPTLADTVLAYLDRAGNVAQTAADLHIHRQTLYNRLAKAEKLTTLDLQDGRDRLRLHMGLLLAPLVAADDRPPDEDVVHTRTTPTARGPRSRSCG